MNASQSVLCYTMDITQKIEDTDAILMIAVSSGCEKSLRMLIDKWKNPIINFFYRSVRDLHLAQDLSQQTFINLYKARHSYVTKAKFSTYLFFIARNVLINEYRRSQRHPTEATDPATIHASVTDNDTLHLKELEEIFDSCLETLPENQRTAILLLTQQNLSYEEIATLMQTNLSTIKTWIHRARNTLKEALKNHG